PGPERLADGDDVGRHAAPLAREPAAGTAETGDHFVGDEDGAVLLGNLLRPDHELRRRDHVARRPLQRLHDHGGDAAGRLVAELVPGQVRAGDAAAGILELERTTVAI